MLSRARESAFSNDRMRVDIRHDGLKQSVVIPLQQAEEVTVEKFLSKIENVLQSEESLSIDESFEGEFSSS